jgi:hypothetical protein
VTEDNIQQPAEADGSQERQPELSAAYDSYRSLADSNLIVIVPKHAVPPFRFKAGGWELLQSSVELDSAAKASIRAAPNLRRDLLDFGKGRFARAWPFISSAISGCPVSWQQARPPSSPR